MICARLISDTSHLWPVMPIYTRVLGGEVFPQHFPYTSLTLPPVFQGHLQNPVFKVFV